MKEGHSRHLASALTAIEEAARQMKRAACEGKSPASSQALTPLEPEEWATLAVPLAEMQKRLSELIVRLAPEQLVQRRTAEERQVTLYWLSFLLLRLDDDIIADLDPAHTEPKFGKLPIEERLLISRLVEELHSDAGMIRAQIEAMRQGKDREFRPDEKEKTG
jgi:hypothetical protein